MAAPTLTHASIGAGAVFNIYVASTATPVGGLKTVNFSGMTTKYDDTTNLGSTLNAAGNVVFTEKIPVSQDPGTLSIAGVFLPLDAGQAALIAAYATQAVTEFSIQFPKMDGQTTSGNLYTGYGWVTDLPTPDVQADKSITFKTVINLAAPMVETVGS